MFDLVLILFALICLFYTEHTQKGIGPGDHSESLSHTELNSLWDPAEDP